MEECESHNPESIVWREFQMHNSEYTLVLHVRDVVILCDIVCAVIDLDRETGKLSELCECTVADKQIVIYV